MTETHLFSASVASRPSGYCRVAARIILTVFFVGFFLLSSQAQEAQSVLGEWYTEEGRAKIEIYECEEGYCGKIVWLKIR